MQDTVGHVEVKVKINVEDLEGRRIIRTGALVDTGVTSTTPQSPVNKLDPVKSGGEG